MVFIKWLESKLGRLLEENKSRISNKFTNTEMTSNICERSDRLSPDLKKFFQNATDRNKIIKIIYETMFLWWINLLNSDKQINPNIKNKAIQACFNWREPIKIIANSRPDKALVVSSFKVYVISLLIEANIGFLCYFHNLKNRWYRWL